MSARQETALGQYGRKLHRRETEHEKQRHTGQRQNHGPMSLGIWRV
jgi:hypothetical protein